MAEVERGAMGLARAAYVEARGIGPQRVETAVWAYLWACENLREENGLRLWPSLNELRAALVEAGLSEVGPSSQC